jgi:hypothetical protein
MSIRSRIKRPLICLAVCLAAFALGTGICYPGICGCTGWLPFRDRDSFGTFGLAFMFLAFGGAIGTAISLLWFLAAALRDVARRTREL